MKKTAIIGGVVLLLGLVVALAGYVLSGGDLSVVNGTVGPLYVSMGTDGGAVGFGSTGKGERREESVPVSDSDSVSYEYDTREVQTIDVEESAANIIVEPSRNGKVHLSVVENDRRSYSVTCKDGVLRVKSEVDSGVPLSFGDWDAAEVRLALPEGMTLDIENDAGNIRISEIDLAAAELDCDAGNIELTDVQVAGKLVIGCDAGNIVLDAVSAGYVEAECSMGEIVVENVNAGKLLVDNDCGNILLDGAAARESMSLNCSLGNVSGTIRGHMDDYAITSDVNLGENNLPDGTHGGVALQVDVDCGNIEIEFEED